MEVLQDSTPVIIEQTIDAPANKVWKAITILDQMKNWYFENIPVFEPVIGFKTKFEVKSGERTFTHTWEIIEVEPARKLKYLWSYEEYAGKGSVLFELFEQGDNTLLRLTHDGLETFPNQVPEFARESCIAGWNYFIKGRLKEYLEKSN
jgi:uncharacterized protein YndB with AHSA1/START domain